MIVLRRFVIALTAAFAAAIVYATARLLLPVAVALVAASFTRAGGGAATGYVSEGEVLIVAALTFAAVFFWRVGFRRKG